MTGFKESLLTRVLCIVHPEWFLTLLQYSSGDVGKREIARAVWGPWTCRIRSALT